MRVGDIEIETPRFKPHDSVMLNNDASPELQLLLGSEAVMTLVWQSYDMSDPGRWTTQWILIHEHRGRAFFDIPESALRVIGKDASVAQRMIHNEMTKALAVELFSAPIEGYRGGEPDLQ